MGILIQGFWLLMFPLLVLAEPLELVLGTGETLELERIGPDIPGGERILWLSSEFGAQEAEEGPLLAALAAKGFEVWWPDLHRHFFIPSGRDSYESLPLARLDGLIRQSLPRAPGRLWLMASGRAARLALELVRLWQQGPDHDWQRLGGAIVLYPTLSSGVAQAGQGLNLHPIAWSTNIPVFILQPTDSAQRWYLTQVVEALESAGSRVFMQLLPDVGDGFHLRHDSRHGNEPRMRAALPDMLAQAQRLLAGFEPPRTAAIAGAQANAAPRGRMEAGLVPMAEPRPAPPLKLVDVQGLAHELSRHQGRKVLVNFWASWCPPCVKEIPSLGRLQQAFSPDDFLVLSVDVGEAPERVQAFLQKVPAAFPVLLDPTGESVHPWRVQAFPTSYLIDRQGLIRYGYFGALEWDSPEIIRLIQGLDQPLP